jgi:hypothetical protein
MIRNVLNSALLAVLLTASMVSAASAQTAPTQPSPKDTPYVIGSGVGQYVQAAGPSVTGAFDRAMVEIDSITGELTPRQVKDLSFRRRLLELRLLMDDNAFAYDKDRLKGYRDIVDHAYESVGVFQDVADFEKELGTTVAPEVIASRRIEMNEALVAIRDPKLRSEMRRFFSTPLSAPRKGGGPGLWDLTGSVATNSFDAIGNAAELQTGVVRFLQGSDLGVTDIFDPNQALHLHNIRREMRSVVLLSTMFPAISESTRDVVAPLIELIDDYGDVLEAYNAYTFALQAGLDTEKVKTELIREFERSQMIKSQFVENRALDALAIRLNAIRDSHRR